jgi:hypothetical protein
MRESLFDGFGCGLARNLARSLAANAVEYGEQSPLYDRKEAILIDRATRVKPTVAYSAYFKLHRHPS